MQKSYKLQSQSRLKIEPIAKVQGVQTALVKKTMNRKKEEGVRFGLSVFLPRKKFSIILTKANISTVKI